MRTTLLPPRLIGALVVMSLLAACSSPKSGGTPPPDESVYTTAQGPDLSTVWGAQGCDGTPNDTPSERHEKGCFGKVLAWPEGHYAWNRFTGNKRIIPINNVLLPNGKVFTFGAGDDTFRYYPDEADIVNSGKISADVWDPITGEHEVIDNTSTELFCSGQSALPDGRILIAGGHEGRLYTLTGPYLGSKDINLFDHQSNGWLTLSGRMAAFRWYPSSLALPSGEVLIIGGIDARTSSHLPDPSLGNNEPLDVIEIWKVEGDTPSQRLLLNAPKRAYAHDQYPWLFVASNGKVFVAGQDNRLVYLNTDGRGAWEDLADGGMPRESPPPGYDTFTRNSGTATLYAPDKILVAGGSPGDGAEDYPVASALTIDLNLPGKPIVKSISPMHFPRRHHNATILPDGTVWINGGTKGPGVNNQELANRVYDSELWNPDTQGWKLTAKAQKFRSYHSTSLLLPDGRVMTGGGGRCDGCAPEDDNADVEIYWPPYLFNPDGSLARRPDITRYPTRVRYNQRFSVQVNGDQPIVKMTWLRLGSVTHSVNFDQRINYLEFTGAGGNSLYVRTPASPNLAPPGFYLLFAVDQSGVPSTGRIIQIAP
ncbi:MULTISPECIES: glyoxal oxidase [unclassified Meiothermus]|uniref:glyoxal oxidase n=1 Tax=unclassified Meiothermus TaxID=370471 RepID=UPI000D7C01BA|nr:MULTISPECIES: glyoxal oxidase [unclassified Meiothermus]PZA08776.1 hypothetical protein DNA98_01670 [Meiothermus sp. Pnk-1]RYM40602.1 DUF1929 domain-containing protein [Meiothermus sp. PNK-Is4]